LHNTATSVGSAYDTITVPLKNKALRTKDKYFAYVQASDAYYYNFTNSKDPFTTHGQARNAFREHLEKESQWIKLYEEYCSGWMVSEAEKDNCHLQIYERFPLHGINENYLRPLFEEISPFSSLDVNIAIAGWLNLFCFGLRVWIIVWFVTWCLGQYLGAMAIDSNFWGMQAPEQENPIKQHQEKEKANSTTSSNYEQTTAIVPYRPTFRVHNGTLYMVEN
jgi:hypothetical protein